VTQYRGKDFCISFVYNRKQFGHTHSKESPMPSDVSRRELFAAAAALGIGNATFQRAVASAAAEQVESATITAATLIISVGTTTFDAGEYIDIHRVKRYDWVENEMTWNSWKAPIGDGTWVAVAPFETNTISKVGADWTTNKWAGATVRIASGTDAGDEQVVLSNTADQLTIVGTWAVTPDATSTFNMNTWEAGGAVGASDYDSTPAYADVQGPTSTTGWWSTDVTTLVQDARTNRSDIVNMMMKAKTESGTDHYFYSASSEASAGNLQAPHLRITYTLDSRTFQAFVR